MPPRKFGTSSPTTQNNKICEWPIFRKPIAGCFNRNVGQTPQQHERTLRPSLCSATFPTRSLKSASQIPITNFLFGDDWGTKLFNRDKGDKSGQRKRDWKTPLMNQKVNNLGSSEPSLKTYFDVKIGNFKARNLAFYVYEWKTFDPEIVGTMTGQQHVSTSPAHRSCNIKSWIKNY